MFLPLQLPIGEAISVTRTIMGVLFVIMVVDALIHYNRGDLYDGHSHFRKLLTGALVCLVIFAALSAVVNGGGMSDANVLSSSGAGSFGDSVGGGSR